jgi:hypothetical protein
MQEHVKRMDTSQQAGDDKYERLQKDNEALRKDNEAMRRDLDALRGDFEILSATLSGRSLLTNDAHNDQADIGQGYDQVNRQLYSSPPMIHLHEEENRLQLQFLDADFRRKFAHLSDMVTEHDMTWELEPVHGGSVLMCFADKENDWRDYLVVVVKPTLGDDYPCVLRSTKEIKARYRQAMEAENPTCKVDVGVVLYVGRFSSVVATENQLRAMFTNGHIDVTSVENVNHVQA